MNTQSINREKATKYYAAVITFLLFVSATGLMLYHDNALGLKQSIEDERVKTEGLLSEKLSLEKQIAELNKRIASMGTQQTKLNSEYKTAAATLAQREKTISSMNAENKQAKSMIAEVKALRETRDALQSQLKFMESEMLAMRSENEKLKNDNLALIASNEELSRAFANLSQVAINNSLVEATKGKRDHLTVKAAKSKKLKVGFDLPVDMIGNLYFQVITPEGDLVTSDRSEITYEETDVASEMTASIDKVIAAPEKKHIEMSYAPQQKLKSGIYKIDVFSSGTYLGTTRIHLK
jgi:myosin heavy subunit